MNIEIHGKTTAIGKTFDWFDDPLVEEIWETMGEDSGLQVGHYAVVGVGDNCTIDEFTELLGEVEDYFDGDAVRAVEAIRSGSLKFVQVSCSDPKRDCSKRCEWLEWHIARSALQ